ncbi:MAG: MBOAT family protein [Lachnospiraceae bacterium]|nr:MBOAT family protein [Lachnospiraceae bacterium]
MLIIFFYPLVPRKLRRIYLLAASLYFYSGFGLRAFAVLMSVNVLSYLSARLMGSWSQGAMPEPDRDPGHAGAAETCDPSGAAETQGSAGGAGEDSAPETPGSAGGAAQAGPAEKREPSGGAGLDGTPAPREQATSRKVVLAVTLALMFLSLGMFKWSAFGLLLPVGMSFYTFAAAGYVIDVYKGRIEPERNPVTCFLFLSFFPNISSGPIERTHSLLPQLKNAHLSDRPSFDRLCSGFIAVLWGYFLKLVIADRLAILVDNVWQEYYLFGSVELFIISLLYVIQLYADFSGYSLIAAGSARMLGFDLTENFHAPLLSQDPVEFWRRWHMSLMNWFRDYVYIPLGGNRKGKTRKYLNSMAVFLISGVWHGAGLNFPVWGLMCGAGVVVCSLFRERRFPAGNAARPSAGDVASAGDAARPSAGVVTSADDAARPSAGGVAHAGDTARPETADVVRRTSPGANETPGMPDGAFSRRLWKTGLNFVTISLIFIFVRADSLASACGFASRLFSHFDPWVLFDGTLYSLGLPREQVMVLIPALLLMFFADIVIDRYGLQFHEFIMRQDTWLKVLTPALLLTVILAYGVYGPGFDAGSFLYFGF